MPISLQCPRCNGAVSVADQAAGQRVKCPHCEQTFLAPGIAETINDDDDWLSLDETPKGPTSGGASLGKVPPQQQRSSSTPGGPPSKPKPPATPKPSAKPSEDANTGKRPPAPTPVLSGEDEALLAEFTSDLDDFTAEIETPPPPHPSAAAMGGKSTEGIPAARGAGATAKSNPKPASELVEYAKEYRVPCHVCGSFMYAKATQAGKTVRCSDCHSPITIPPPPRIKKTTQFNLEEAETFTLGQSKNVDRGPDPYQKSAQQLLDEASREEETNPGPTYDDTPSVTEWAKTVFGIFKDLGVVVHWLGLTLLACIPTVIALKLDQQILILGLFPAGFFLGVLTVSCGFAILHSVANEEESVTEWPTLDPFAWLGQLFVVVAAASLVAVPLWAVCMVILGPSLISAAITMFAVYVMFPFVLLSMLDMNSAFVPFSPEVARSVTKCEEAWGGFYFTSGLLFVALFLIFAVASSSSMVVGAVISIAATIGATFIYFSMIGRLAYAIGQAVNAPPMQNDIDRTRPGESG